MWHNILWNYSKSKKNIYKFRALLLQANDAHPSTAEKRNNPFFSVMLLCHVSGLSPHHSNPPFLPLSIVLILFTLTREGGAVSLWQLYFCFVFFSLVNTFSLSVSNLQLSKSRWHLEHTSAPASASFPHPSLETLTECGFPSLRWMHLNIFTQKHQTGAHSLVSAVTPLAHCHLAKLVLHQRTALI